jgi:hypothetical protein
MVGSTWIINGSIRSAVRSRRHRQIDGAVDDQLGRAKRRVMNSSNSSSSTTSRRQQFGEEPSVL